MYRASPPRKAADLSLVEASAAGTPNTDTFVNLFRSTVRHEGGFAHGEFALMPDLAQYDRIRFSFGEITLADVDTATLQVWGMGSEGIPYLLGTSELGADGTFPPVEFDNHQATYQVVLGELSSDGSPEVTVSTFVQGVYEAPYTRG